MVGCLGYPQVGQLSFMHFIYILVTDKDFQQWEKNGFHFNDLDMICVIFCNTYYSISEVCL